MHRDPAASWSFIPLGTQTHQPKEDTGMGVEKNRVTGGE